MHRLHVSVTLRATHVCTYVCDRVFSCVPPGYTCVHMYVCVHVHPVTHLAPVFCQWNSKAGRVLFLAKINVIGSLVFRMESPAWALPAALFAPLNLKRSASYTTAPPPPLPPALPSLPPAPAVAATTTNTTMYIFLSLVPSLSFFKIGIHFGISTNLLTIL